MNHTLEKKTIEWYIKATKHYIQWNTYTQTNTYIQTDKQTDTRIDIYKEIQKKYIYTDI